MQGCRESNRSQPLLGLRSTSSVVNYSVFNFPTALLHTLHSLDFPMTNHKPPCWTRTSVEGLAFQTGLAFFSMWWLICT